MIIVFVHAIFMHVHGGAGPWGCPLLWRGSEGMLAWAVNDLCHNIFSYIRVVLYYWGTGDVVKFFICIIKRIIHVLNSCATNVSINFPDLLIQCLEGLHDSASLQEFRGKSQGNPPPPPKWCNHHHLIQEFLGETLILGGIPGDPPSQCYTRCNFQSAIVIVLLGGMKP